MAKRLLQARNDTKVPQETLHPWTFMSYFGISIVKRIDAHRFMTPSVQSNLFDTENLGRREKAPTL
jgi:hypothetical protein